MIFAHHFCKWNIRKLWGKKSIIHIRINPKTTREKRKDYKRIAKMKELLNIPNDLMIIVGRLLSMDT